MSTLSYFYKLHKTLKTRLHIGTRRLGISVAPCKDSGMWGGGGGGGWDVNLSDGIILASKLLLESTSNFSDIIKMLIYGIEFLQEYFLTFFLNCGNLILECHNLLVIFV